MMKSLAKLHPEQGIWMQQTPVPELGHNDLLIRIHKTAICGTDIHITTGTNGPRTPFRYR